MAAVTQMLAGDDHNPIRCEVAHAVPGRIRLHLPGEEASGGVLAGQLAERPGVERARWNGTARCLVVHYDPLVPLGRILEHSDRVPRRELLVEPPTTPLWRRFVLPAVALLAGIVGTGPARVVLAACSLPIARRAVRSLIRRHLSIDVLDVLAVGLLLGINDLLAAGVTIGLVETGERIREQAAGRTRRLLRGWMGADQPNIRVLRADQELLVARELVGRGDQVVVYPGEGIPVDGVIIAGSGTADNRSWTGEALPVAVRPGEPVLAGAALTDGRLVVTVVAVGDETRAGRLALALESAIAANTRTSDMARQIADRFVAPILIAAGATFVVTRSLPRLISMLIIDFGTGLRVSIPTTILASMMAGARAGVFFKQGTAVEALARVDAVIFDKTGTLTTGVPRVTGFIQLAELDRKTVLRLAAGAEGGLPHPMAGAIVRHARRLGLQQLRAEHVSFHPGGGVVARVDGHEVVVGDSRLLAEQGIDVVGAHGESSVAWVAVDGRAAGVMRMNTPVRREAAAVVSKLRALGIAEIHLASGDHHAAVRPVAARTSIQSFRGRMTPEDKVDLVHRLQAAGRRVAVVGDGLNDATAMAAAEVGVAMASGVDLTRGAADVVLVRDDLEALVDAVRLAQGAMRLVRQNIGLVAAPNGIGILLATLGQLDPLSAAMLNNGSVLLASANGLRPLLGRGGR